MRIKKSSPSMMDLEQYQKLIPSKGRIFFAGLIDFGLIFGLVIGTVLLAFETSNSPSEIAIIFIVVPIYFIIMVIFFRINKTTFGMFCVGVIYISGDSGIKLDASMYWDFWLSSILTNLKYSDEYELFYYLTNSNNQTKAMNRKNIFYAKLEVYNKMMKSRELPFARKNEESTDEESSFRLNL